MYVCIHVHCTYVCMYNILYTHSNFGIKLRRHNIVTRQVKIVHKNIKTGFVHKPKHGSATIKQYQFSQKVSLKERKAFNGISCKEDQNGGIYEDMI